MFCINVSFILYLIVINCGPAPTVVNAAITSQTGGTTVGAVVQWACNTCYTGGGAVVCGSNGQWSASPTCLRMLQSNTIFYRNPRNIRAHWEIKNVS